MTEILLASSDTGEYYGGNTGTINGHLSGEKFNLSVSSTITRIIFNGTRLSTTTQDLICTIYNADSYGRPTGSPLGALSVPASEISITQSNITFLFNLPLPSGNYFAQISSLGNYIFPLTQNDGDTSDWYAEYGNGYWSPYFTRDLPYWVYGTTGVEPQGICQWITAKGGAAGLDVSEVFQIIDSYVFQTPPTGYTFVPTITQVMGIIDYYLGFIASGNQKTGCSF